MDLKRTLFRPGHAAILTALGTMLTVPGAGAAERLTAPERRHLDISVYQAGVAVVRDRRELDLEAGPQQIEWPFVAESLQPDTVRLDGSDLVLEGYRRADRPLTLARLLSDHVGRRVRVEPDSGEPYEGRLRSADPVLVETLAGLRSAAADEVIFPRGADTRPPTLRLDADVQAGGRRPVTLAYLADGLGWSLDYVGTLSADGTRLDLAARAHVANDAGLDIHGARVELVAGAPHIPEGQGRPAAESVMRATAAPAAPEPAGPYHRLALQQPLSLAEGERTTVSVFRRPDIDVRRVHVLRAGPRPLTAEAATPGWDRVPLTMTLSWPVEAAQPGGTVRVYQPREDGAGLRLLGGADLGDRAAGERARIGLGRPSDVSAERRRTDWRRLDERRVEAAWEIRLRNAGSRPASVRVEEVIPGEWDMVRSSHDWERAASNLAVWPVEVPPDGEITLRYEVRIRR